MNDARRFMRLTLPGLSTVLMAVIAFSASGHFSQMQIITEPGLSEALGIVAGIFLASGALGYLLANLYFSLRWIYPLSRWAVVDHLTVLKELEKFLEVLKPSTGSWRIQDLTKRNAWSIVTQYWVSHSTGDSDIKGTNPTVDRFADITHGLGASCLGSTILFFVWLFACLFKDIKPKCFVVLITALIWILVIAVLCHGFRSALIAFQTIVNSTFIGNIRNKYDEKNEKVKIYYSP